MANVAFKKGLLANLPSTKTAGTFYVTTDERAIYLDIDASNRIRIGDFQEFATVAALEANTNPSTTALYYVTAINCLAKWDGTKYVQINLDTGATSIEVVGDGNAVTTASYNASTRKITLTKGATYTTSSDVETAIQSAITTLDLDNTYEAKGAAATAKAEVIGASTDAASANTIYGAKAYADAAADDKDTAIQAAQDAADAAQGDVDALETLVGTIPSGATATDVVGYAAEVADAAETAAKAVANAKVASVSATDNKGIEIGGTATAPTVGIKLSSKANNDLRFATGTGEDGGLYYHAPAAAEYSIAKAATAETGYFATYNLTKDGTVVGASINIPKDYLVKSASVGTVTAADKAEGGKFEGDSNFQVGDKYIDFVVNVYSGTATDEHIYLNVKDLVDVYTSGSASGDMVVIAIDSSNQITATISDGTVTLAKLDSSVQAEINKAHTHSNKSLLDTYTQTETDLADAVAKKHEHSNKSVLDGIAATDIAAWNGAVTDQHTHSNKTVLDGIAASDITAWNGEIGSAAAITAIKDGTDIDSFGDVETALSGKLAGVQVDGTDLTVSNNKVNIVCNTAYNASTNKIATMSDVSAAALAWGSF